MTAKYRIRKKSTNSPNKRKRDSYHRNMFDNPYDVTSHIKGAVTRKDIAKLRHGSVVYRAVILGDCISVEGLRILSTVRVRPGFHHPKALEDYKKMEETSRSVHAMIYDDPDNPKEYVNRHKNDRMVVMSHMGYMQATRNRFGEVLLEGDLIQSERVDFFGRSATYPDKIVHRSANEALDATERNLYYVESLSGSRSFSTHSIRAMKNACRMLLGSAYSQELLRNVQNDLRDLCSSMDYDQDYDEHDYDLEDEAIEKSEPFVEDESFEGTNNE